jgi:ABC-type sugar transport system substrate-binding protein
VHRVQPLSAVALLAGLVLCGCDGSSSKGLKIGVAFETLQTEYWVASFEALKAELDGRHIEMIEAIADNDANRQLDQIHTFIARRVDGIIVAPRDATTVVPMIRAANEAGIPIVIYNRPPAENPFHSVTVVADNYELAKATVTYMARQAEKTGKKYKAMILIGDLGDINAIGRRDGFEDALRQFPDTVEVVARVPTEWSQDVARAGVINALQVNPDIDFIFSSSDFLFPSLVSALKEKGKYKKIGQQGHVLLGGFDGDSMAYRMLADRYLDACGVQDVYFECAQSVEAILRMRRGEQLDATIRDRGFVIHQGNLRQQAKQMWGAQVAQQRSTP